MFRSPHAPKQRRPLSVEQRIRITKVALPTVFIAINLLAIRDVLL